MGWTPLFLKMDTKKVLIVGAGEVGERRAKRFLESGADVVIIEKDVSNDLVGLGASFKPLDEVEEWVEWSDIVIAATSDHSLNQRIAELADEKLLNFPPSEKESGVTFNIPITRYLPSRSYSRIQ